MDVAELFKGQEDGVAELRVEFALEGGVDDHRWECGFAFQLGQGVIEQVCKAVVDALNLDARRPGARIGVDRSSTQADGGDHRGKAVVEGVFEIAGEMCAKKSLGDQGVVDFAQATEGQVL